MVAGGAVRRPRFARGGGSLPAYGRGNDRTGLRPLPALHHFTNPLWFTPSGGWSRADAVKRFLRYVDALVLVLVLVLGASVQRVETINEPNIFASLGKLRAAGAGSLAQGLPVPDAAVAQAIIAVHQATRKRLKEQHPELLVGWGVSVQDYQAEPGAEDALARYVYPRDEIFLEAAPDGDWVGVQTYTRRHITAAAGQPIPVRDPAAPLTQTGWEDYPAALGGAVRRAARVVGEVPLIVTENGIATADDTRRIAFTARSARLARSRT